MKGLWVLELLCGLSLVLWNLALLRLGLRRRVDGWRRGVGVMLRGEAARFYLSAFSLDLFSDEPGTRRGARGRSVEEIQGHVRERLRKFLEGESEFFVLVRRGAEEDVVVGHSQVSYSLGFESWVEGAGRFVRPKVWVGGFSLPLEADCLPVFEFVCRINRDQCADLWVRVNHVASDGVAAQEMMSRLEKAWGVKSVVFPSRAECEAFEGARFTPGREGMVEVQCFIEFGRLLDWRKQQNAKLAEPITFGAAMIWLLARHEVFSGLYLGTTVELAAMDGVGRGVGVVVVRPGDYFGRQNGLALYVRDFNRQLELTRLRRSEGCRKLDAAAFLPARLERKLMSRGLEQGKGAFGRAGVTILKEAKVFGAPMGDVGHADGFIAVGSVGLQTTDGKRVGCVVVKGPRGRISAYAKVLREAMEDFVEGEEALK